jgi:hypothetical protein
VTELAIDDEGDIVVDWTAQTGHAVVGFYLDKDQIDPRATLVNFVRMPVCDRTGLVSVLRVDVDRANKTFFPELSFVLDRSRQFP